MVLDPDTLERKAMIIQAGTWAGHAASWDRRWYAYNPGDKVTRIRLADLSTGTIVEDTSDSPIFDQVTKSMSFRPGNDTLAISTTGGKARLLQVPSLAHLPSALDDETDVFGVKFSPDGRWLVTLNGEGSLELRDGRTFEIVRTMVGTTLAQVNDADIRFVGDELLFARVDGSARLWDLASGQAIGDPFPNDEGVRGLPVDGSQSLVTGVGPDALIWNIDTTTWFDLACRAAGRNLTRQEWEQFGPADAPYEATCAQWPLP